MRNVKETDNDWAKTVQQEAIHIDTAESGRKGYFCLGCGKEMEAVKQRKDPSRQSYFRHAVKDAEKAQVECVVASKQYRERLAEQILHRLKSIKVPPLYKYPPKGEGGYPMLIEESRIVQAFKVRSQLSFYENENGEIHWGKNPEILDRDLLIRPDVTFFDHQEKPILFIEFVITHKINDEKKLKLRRLGIDTIQIIIPKKPENEIEKTLKSIRSTKWVYNAKEANAKYVPPASGDPGTVLDLDEDQRKLFEESFKCRSSEIKNLIRSIKRSLGSESYRKAEQLLERAISKTERATEGIRQELERMESSIEGEVSSETEIHFRKEERTLDVEERKFGAYYSRVERRYRELASDFENKRGQYIKEERELDNLIREQERFNQPEEAIRRKISELERAEEAERRSFEKAQAEIGKRTVEIRSKNENFGEYAEKAEGKLRGRFEDIQDETAEKISQRNASGDPELSRRIEAVLRTRGLCSSYEERTASFKRAKEALQFIRGRTWES